jgi:hypothetical protein
VASASRDRFDMRQQSTAEHATGEQATDIILPHCQGRFAMRIPTL